MADSKKHSRVDLCVVYFVNNATFFTNADAVDYSSPYSADPEQQKAVNNYIELTNPNAEVVGMFYEPALRKNPWDNLSKALDLCKQKNATLIIAEMENLIAYDSFVNILMNSGVNFYCSDLNFIDTNSLIAVHQFARYGKTKHGARIRDGLRKTKARSGNPNAAAVISKVNKPKIDTAIVFAFLLSGIIKGYQKSGYSQRHMVKMLNQEGFTAPEGGNWVLSQLQKVLDRIRLNEIAIEHKDLLQNLDNLSREDIAQELNNKGIASLKRNSWDAPQVAKLIHRVKQIKDIIDTNEFMSALLPVIQSARKSSTSVNQLLKHLNQYNVALLPDATSTFIEEAIV